MVAPLWATNTIKKFVLPEKVGQSSPNFFMRCRPLRPPIMPNFIEIGQTSLEKSVKKCYLFSPSRHFFCHGQKRVMSRSLREARLKTGLRLICFCNHILQPDCHKLNSRCVCCKAPLLAVTSGHVMAPHKLS